ncbi:MAG: transglycosylase SLT domain-containing protein [Treponema sp.]|nr:transglycosylase SLT domain-containing protein [Treponema sp.]
MNSRLLIYSAVLCLTSWFLTGSFSRSKDSEPAEIPAQKEALPWLEPALYHTTAMDAAKAPDPILTAYKNGDRERIVSFFAALTGSPEFAVIILNNAAQYDIAPALAFALCWEESRYNKNAVHQNKNGSIDRGLFQLNSQSFPELSTADFFTPEINVQYALAHLRWCIDKGGSELSGLAMYNVGTNRVSKGGTPKATLDYISRIIGYRRGIESLYSSNVTGQPRPFSG